MSTTKLFPIGTMSSSASTGTVDSISYSMFEPNNGCTSAKQYNILTTMFQSQVMLTRKKSDSILGLSYKYDSIFTKEFRQLEHFIYDNDDALNSFLCIDWSKGFTPTSVTASGNDWVVATLNTSDYSVYDGYKSFRAFVWDGSSKKFRVGNIVSLTAHTSFTIDLDANEYGDLAIADANSSGTVYPLYECYPEPNILSKFTTTNYIHGYDISASAIGGYMYSGEVKFVTKYKV